MSPKIQIVLFDWGDTVMVDMPGARGPMDQWVTVEAVPGVADVLPELANDFALGLATNARDSDEAAIRRALKRCDLNAFFRWVFCFRKIGIAKTDPAYYHVVLKALAVSPTSVLMVGDTFSSDVEAPNAVGKQAVWFNPRTKEASSGPLHRTIHSLSQLPDALRSFGP